MVSGRYSNDLETPRCFRRHHRPVLVPPWLILLMTKLNGLTFAVGLLGLPKEKSLFWGPCDLFSGTNHPSIYFMMLIQSLGHGGSRLSILPTLILKRPQGYFKAFPGHMGQVIPPVCSGSILWSPSSWTWWKTSTDRCLKGILIRCLDHFH